MLKSDKLLFFSVLSITTPVPVSLLANEFDVRSVLHWASELGSCQIESNLCNS